MSTKCFILRGKKGSVDRNMYYQTRTMMPGGGSISPAVKGLIIANVCVFILQAVQDDSFVFTFGLVPHDIWTKIHVWQDQRPRTLCKPAGRLGGVRGL